MASLWIQNTAQDIPVNIIVANGTGFENGVGINKLRFPIFNPIDLCHGVGFIYIKKHNPAGRWKEEFNFWQLAMKERIEIEITGRLVVKNECP